MSDCSLNWMDNHRLTIVVGHAGSGKTEFSVNLAVALAQAGKKTCLADFLFTGMCRCGCAFSSL